ncbi:MAG: saccharopine dehydrogenase family protein [Chloroflexota bacterium]
MDEPRWMIYGATGYTGKLLVAEAVKRGYRPVIAGRSAEKLKAIAAPHGLAWQAFPVDNVVAVADALRQAEVRLVLHAAGPFTHTAAAMRRACIQTGAHYLDITGEIGVFEASFAADRMAREAGVLVMSGVGFDIVPSDCLVKYVADQLPDADTLDVVISALSPSQEDFGVTAGTLKSLLEMLPGGVRVRRGGRLVPVDFGSLTRMVSLPRGTREALAIPWGDVSTAYRTTGIPNITVYMTLSRQQTLAARYAGVVAQWLMRYAPVRRSAGRQIDRFVTGPTEHTRQTARAYIYARVENRAGEVREAWLETMEGYAYTVIAALNAVDRALTDEYSGALTPAQAFGTEFALEVPTTRRMDTL